MARLASVQERWEMIQAAARAMQIRPADWKAAAWSVERTWPKDFGRPETQIAVQTNMMMNGCRRWKRNLDRDGCPIGS